MTFSLTGANGDTITFDNTNYLLRPGFIGFGIPPTSVRIDSSARDGGTWRYSKRNVRNVDLPITIFADNEDSVETKFRRLARLVQDKNGPTILTAVRGAGDLTLEVHYTGGAELTWGGGSAGNTWASVLLSFQAPQPYWESAETESFTVSSGNTGRGLLPQLSKLKLSSSQAIGIINVNNTSDVDVYPEYLISGPVTDLVISNGTQSFGFNATIDEGVTIAVNTEDGTVLDSGDSNRYDLLLPSPKLFPFPPGVSSILVTGTNTNINTNIVCEYNLRYEVVHNAS